MLRSRSFQLMHNLDEKEKEPKFPVLKESFGADIYVLAKDREIFTNPEETKRRRAIRLLRSNHNSWGFTLQTYGIRNKKTREIEVTTYVDYVELHSPAWLAGIQRGDVILSVNGESVENDSHHDLVTKIKKSSIDLRLAVLFENCCTKIDLQDRCIKLKKMLQLKLKELYCLEDREKKLKETVLQSRKDLQPISVSSSMSTESDTYINILSFSEQYQPSRLKCYLSPIDCEGERARDKISIGSYLDEHLSVGYTWNDVSSSLHEEKITISKNRSLNDNNFINNELEYVILKDNLVDSDVGSIEHISTCEHKKDEPIMYTIKAEETSKQRSTSFHNDLIGKDNFCQGSSNVSNAYNNYSVGDVLVNSVTLSTQL
ncbi:uncharacterized protein LOC106058455 [Biomphalaria glabrata]|uniref:Uncharacterized protein LOC106058455 n=1 Tax=Biomphalaria glabrata TaxID=6526 RepID=A0A9W2Z601_BIOGL|nr:uncharacterized protein LOC106058455 [Biomphalaria glabrata]XP_055870352.1 uncharacterized protein LOC106058455 [Biomphalaria glabrata]